MLDESGQHVVVHYRIGRGVWGATLLSVYVNVERGIPLADEYEATKTEIIREYPNATILSEGDKTVAALSGREVVMDLPATDDGRVRRTSFSAYENGKVMLRLRASYPAAEAAQRAPQVAELIDRILSSGP